MSTPVPQTKWQMTEMFMKLWKRTGFFEGSQMHKLSLLNCLCIFCFIITDNEWKIGCLNTQKGRGRSLREPSTLGSHKLIKCFMGIVQLFYSRYFVRDKMKRYIRANKKVIIKPSCRYLAKFASMQKIRQKIKYTDSLKLSKMFRVSAAVEWLSELLKWDLWLNYRMINLGKQFYTIFCVLRLYLQIWG